MTNRWAGECKLSGWECVCRQVDRGVDGWMDKCWVEMYGWWVGRGERVGEGQTDVANTQADGEMNR